MWLESIWGNEILTIFEILKQPNKSCDWNQHRGNEILTMLKILNASNRSLYWNQFEAMKYWQYWNRQTDLVAGINLRGNERRVQSRARQSHLYVDNLTCRKLPFVTKDGSHTKSQNRPKYGSNPLCPGRYDNFVGQSRCGVQCFVDMSCLISSSKLRFSIILPRETICGQIDLVTIFWTEKNKYQDDLLPVYPLQAS